jgi:HPt (histidine-containing phosphotransfer) domain-containing protein
MTHTHPTSSNPPSGPPATPTPLDLPSLLANCMGNASLVAMLLDKFEKQAREDTLRIEHALAAGDAGLTARHSHALKGAAGALTAGDIYRSAAAIELAARQSQLESAAQLLIELRSDVDRCLAYLPTARAAARSAPNAPATAPRTQP